MFPQRITNAMLAALLAAAALVMVSSPASATQSNDGWVLLSDGSVRVIGQVPHYGDATGDDAKAIVSTASGQGYLVVFRDGRVEAFGDAVHYGDASNLDLRADIVDIVLTDRGYLLLATDGGVFTYGDARFHGSAPQILGTQPLDAPAVGVIPSSDGLGYAIVFADGGVFNFGSSRFVGSLPALGITSADLDGPIVGAVNASDGNGYGLVGSDGGVFAFGSYAFLGSLADTGQTFVAMDLTAQGYALVSGAGSVSFVGDDTGERSVGVLDAVTAVDLAVAPQRTTATTSTTVETTAAPTPTTAAPTPTTAAPTPTTAAPTPTTAAPTPTTAAPTPTTAAPTPTTAAPTNTTLPGIVGTEPGRQITVMSGVNETHVGIGGEPTSIQVEVNWPSTGMFSPVDYANGTSFARVHVKEKPTNILMAGQFCFWYQRDGWNAFEETCSSEHHFSFRTTGVYYVALGTPNDWWELTRAPATGDFDWINRPQVARLLPKDLNTNTLFTEIACGKYCWSGGDAFDHLPLTVDLELIFVEAGKRFVPPAHWTGNPWS